MKKTICWFLILICITGCFYGCVSADIKPVSLGDSMEIPDDGIISSSVFESLKQENKAAVFYGESNGFRYEWTVFGGDIEEIKDLNLGIEITAGDIEKVSFRCLSDENFGFSPLLSIYLNEKWETRSVAVYKVSESDSVQICSASITGSDKSILNFSAETQTGYFEIKPFIQASKPVQSEAPAENNEHDFTVSEPEVENIEADLSENNSTVSEMSEPSSGNTNPASEDSSESAGTENTESDKRKAYTCTFSVECSAVLNNLKNLEADKLDVIPSNGIIFASQTVTFYEGESVFDLLQRICRENKIHLEASWTPVFNSAYVEGICNLYEFDCGSGSGWMYRVDGWYPNYGCSSYQLKQDDIVEWRYTCDFGKDIGGRNFISE